MVSSSFVGEPTRQPRCDSAPEGPPTPTGFGTDTAQGVAVAGGVGGGTAVLLGVGVAGGTAGTIGSTWGRLVRDGDGDGATAVGLRLGGVRVAVGAVGGTVGLTTATGDPGELARISTAIGVGVGRAGVLLEST